MSKMKLCRKLLVEEVESLKQFLLSEALSSEKYPSKLKDSTAFQFDEEVYVLEEYKKELKGLNILVFLSSKDEPKVFESLEKFCDITKEVRYTKEYLKLFGNPSKYDFELEDVYKRCDSVGSSRMDLHFQGGMQSAKVLKVLLYRLNQLFKLSFEEYTQTQHEYEELMKTLENLKYAFHLAKGLFNKKILKAFLQELEDIYKLINHTDKIQRYFINFEAFIKENTGFYETKKADEAIYFFLQEQVQKILQISSSKIDEKEITFMLEMFPTLFSEEEKNGIQLEVQKLKRI
jgi:hypothetical protein